MTKAPSRHPDPLGTSPIPYECDYMTDELRRRAKVELFEDEETRVNSLRLLKSMLNDEKDLDWPDDDLLLLAFLRTRKFDVKRACSLVKTFYTVAAKHHELYENFNYDDVRKTLKENTVGFLPYRDSEGCVILVIRTAPWNPHVNRLGDIMRALTCGLFHAIRMTSTQIAGFKVIVDFAGCGIAKLPHISPTYLWLFAEALQNCFPARFRAVHMVNEGQVVYYIWTVVLKQLLSKKLRDRFHFHGKNVKKLHKHFPPSILPAEFQGELPPFDNREWATKLGEASDHLNFVFSHGYRKRRRSKSEEKKSTEK